MPRSLQGPFQIRFCFLASFAQKIRPKINHQSDQEIVQSLAQKTTTKMTRK